MVDLLPVKVHVYPIGFNSKQSTYEDFQPIIVNQETWKYHQILTMTVFCCCQIRLASVKTVTWK